MTRRTSDGQEEDQEEEDQAQAPTEAELQVTCPSGCCPTYRDHLLSVGISASATPTRTPEPNRIDATESRWSRDMDAYRRLRREGLQPRTIDGAANVESKAETRSEVESGVILQNRVQRAQVKDILGDDA